MTNATTTNKVIVITGGTSGIGYQTALGLAQQQGNTVVVTGRRQESAEKAVASIQQESKNDKVHYALADLSLQSGVQALVADILQRFPVVDELINNAGNFSPEGVKDTTTEGIDKNFAVNVVAPLLLTRGLVPALTAASPTGKVQNVSGGLPTHKMDMDDLESKKVTGLLAYSRTKRVMEAMTIALSREMEPHGIVVNVVGGGGPAATNMTGNMTKDDVSGVMRLLYPVLKNVVFKEDGGKSAKKCAQPNIWGVTANDIGTGQNYLRGGPRKATYTKQIQSKETQDAVMTYVESVIIQNA